MTNVELIYDGDCPNVDDARAQLRSAMTRLGLAPRWREWRGDAPDAPAHVRGHGSPTILVDGRDVVPGDAGAAGEDGPSCRLYRDDAGAPSTAPSAAVIAHAINRARGREAGGGDGPRAGWRGGLAVLPAIGVALLPKVACPACWPAYAGFLSTVGLGFLLDTTVLLPMTAAFLAIALGALAFRASRRRGFGPFALGAVGAAIVLVGKFVLGSDPSMYGGLAVLIGASLWNTWPVRRRSAACPACEPGAPPSA